MPSPIHDSRYSSAELRHLRSYNEYVGLWLWLYFIIVLGSATFLNLYTTLHGARRRKRVSEYLRTGIASRQGCSRTGKSCTRWVPATIVALFRKLSIRKGHWTAYIHISNLGQLILILSYAVVNLSLMCGGAYNDVSWQAHHAARLAAANLPLVIGLASKNNLISFLTGFAYESLNVFHRWTARMVVLLSIIHVAGRIHINEPSCDPRHQPYIILGIVAWICLIWMMLSSFRIVRDRFYSFFIITHVAALVLLFVSLWIHRPQIRGWIIAGVAIYSLDRIWRTARIIMYHTLFKVDGNSQSARAWVEALSSDTIRVTVRTRQTWTPGSHVYLHCPSISAGGHPFTVASIGERGIESESQQILLVRVRSGVTRKLYDLAVSTKDQDKEMEPKSASAWPRANIYAWTEGPYGQVRRFGEEYETLLLVSGGSGVSYCLPLMLDIVSRASQMQANPDVAVTTQRIHFVWVIRSEEQINWIGSQLAHALSIAPKGLLQVTIHCTSKNASATYNSPDSLSSRANFSLKRGRPDMQALVATEISRSHYTDWVAVATCGPTSLTSNLANAVSDSIWLSRVLKGEHRRNVYFKNEEFGW